MDVYQSSRLGLVNQRPYDPHRRRPLGLSCLALTVLVGCTGSEPTGAVPGGAGRIAVTGPVVLTAAEPQVYSATYFDSDDRPGHASFQWSLTSPSTGLIGQDGSFTALEPGSQTIRASANGVHGDLAITVRPPTPFSIVATPSADTLTIGEEGIVDVRVVDRLGREIAVNGSWRLTAQGASVQAFEGAGRGLGPNTVIIYGVETGVTDLTIGYGRGDARPARVSVLVVGGAVDSLWIPERFSLPLGSSVIAPVELYDAGRTRLNYPVVSWSVLDPSVATASNGIISGVGVGSTVVTAESQGVRASALVQVGQEDPEQIDVRPATLTVIEGESSLLTAVVTGTGGSRLDDSSVVWTSANPEIASVAGQGMVSARQRGVVPIFATLAQLRDSVLITVEPRAMSIVFSPDTMRLSVGQVSDFSTAIFDGDGDRLDLTPSVSISAGSGVVDFNARGAVRALSSGSAMIQATIHDLTGVMPVIVTPSPAAQIVVPDTLLVFFEADTEVSVVVFDEAGAEIEDPDLVWSFEDSTVVHAAAGRLLRGDRRGVSRAIVQSGTATAQTVIKVERERPVRSHSFIPEENLHMAIGGWTFVTLAARDSSGYAASGSINPRVWISDSLLLKIDREPNPPGYTMEITPITPGSGWIYATVDEITDSVPFVVVPERPLRTMIRSHRDLSESLLVGERVRVWFEALDWNAQAIPGAIPWWRPGSASVVPSVIDFDESALEVEALRVGQEQLRAFYGWEYAVATFYVENPAATVTLEYDTVIVRSRQLMYHSNRDRDGNVLYRRPMTGTSSDSDVVRLEFTSGTWVLIPVGPGTAQVEVFADGASASVTVVVPPGFPELTTNSTAPSHESAGQEPPTSGQPQSH